MRFGILQWSCSQSANHPSSSEGKGYFIYKTKSQKSLSKIASNRLKNTKEKSTKTCSDCHKREQHPKRGWTCERRRLMDIQPVSQMTSERKIEKIGKKRRKTLAKYWTLTDSVRIHEKSKTCNERKISSCLPSMKIKREKKYVTSRERRNTWKCSFLYTVLKNATRYISSSALGRKCAHICIGVSHN